MFKHFFIHDTTNVTNDSEWHKRSHTINRPPPGSSMTHSNGWSIVLFCHLGTLRLSFTKSRSRECYRLNDHQIFLLLFIVTWAENIFKLDFNFNTENIYLGNFNVFHVFWLRTFSKHYIYHLYHNIFVTKN